MSAGLSAAWATGINTGSGRQSSAIKVHAGCLRTILTKAPLSTGSLPENLSPAARARTWGGYLPTAPRSRNGPDFSSDGVLHSRNKSCRPSADNTRRRPVQAAIVRATRAGTPPLRGHRTRRCPPSARSETDVVPSRCCPRPAIPCERPVPLRAPCAHGAEPAGSGIRRIEKIKNVGLVEACQPAQRADGRTHLRAFNGAQESHRDSRGFGHPGQRESATKPQLAQSHSNGPRGVLRRRSHQPFALEQFNDRRCIQPAHPAQKSCPLEKLDVFGAVESVLALGAAGPGEPQALPGADHRWRNSHHAGHIPDLQVRFGAVRLHPLPACFLSFHFCTGSVFFA